MAEMGMEAIFYARMNKVKFESLKSDGDLEFVWMPTFATDKSEEKHEILAHALHDHYNPPNFVPSGAYMTGSKYSYR